MMSDNERPQKLRKLSHEGQTSRNDDTPNIESIAATTDANETTTAPAVTDGEATVETEFVGDSATTPAANGHIAASVTAEGEGKPMSKNQLKKLRKKQDWEAGRAERKIIRKEKVVAKRERNRAARAQAQEEGGEQQPQPTPEEQRLRYILRPVQLPVTFVFDCDFDNLMRDNERVSLASQITRCYSDNKRSKYRAHLTVSSFGGHLRERFDGLLNQVYKSWKGMRFLDEDFVETAEKAKEWMDDTRGKPFKGAFAKYADFDDAQIEELKKQGEVVYLSSESDDTLTELKPFSTYIIGGLVDKNREKGICHKRAVQRGIRTAKLPIGDYLEMSSRKVLATNHVNEIMVNWLETGHWGEAFMKVMPKRKGGKLKDENGKGQEGEDPAGEDDGPEAAADEGQALQDEVNKAAEVEAEDGTQEASAVAAS